MGDLVQMLRSLIGADIDLQLLLGEQVPAVNADAGQLQQVLMNLCGQPLAMPRGGKLLLKTEHVSLTASDCALCRDFKPGSYVVLTVADTGCGMSPEVRQRIFEPFFTTKQVGEGTGLGLAMVYGIVQQHDGIIQVFSEVGKGTTFKIFLPVVQGRAAADGDSRPVASPGGNEADLDRGR